MKHKLQKAIAHFLLTACLLLGSGVRSASGSEALLGRAAPAHDAGGQVPEFVFKVQAMVEEKLATAFVLERTSNFTKIAIPQNKNAKFFYVAVPNNIIRLSLETFELETLINWSHLADSTMLRECNVGGTSKEDCNTNRIFALLISNENLLVCGTAFGRPTCSLRLMMQPSHSLGAFDVQLRDADTQSRKALALEGRDVYVGAYLRRGTDPALYRSSLAPDSNPVRTNIEVQQSRALKPIYQPAKFISVHVIGEYAYYFFQENFEEMTTCGSKSQRIISRVARVCKSDPGFHKTWLSFSKSRLVCSQGGNWIRPDGPEDESSVFHFDLLQDTYETDSHIYGLFTAAKNGIKASAICGFPFTTFNKVFGEQTVKIKEWEARDGEAPYAYFADVRDRYNRSDCAALHLNREEIATYTKNHRYNFLKAARVIQDTNDPVASGSENWLRMIVAKVPSAQPGQHHNVAFVLTEALSIKKILLHAGTKCVLEEYQLDPALDHGINDLKLTPTGDHLIVTTDSRILRLPTSQCGRHRLWLGCVSSRDPYCGWNRRTNTCTVHPANTDQWDQDISPQLNRMCPERNTTVRGGWSAWQPWQVCMPPYGTPGPTCVCRSRYCDNPTPRNTAQLCGKYKHLQNETQVANCTVDGGWSPWERWSPCPACLPTEGKDNKVKAIMRERSRTCSQPSQRHGGAPCKHEPRLKDAETGENVTVSYFSGADGADARETETKKCAVPVCTEMRMAVNGTWNPWLPWTQCSRPCGGGVTKRVRYCNKPVNGGLPCFGDSIELKECNTSPCLAGEGAETAKAESLF